MGRFRSMAAIALLTALNAAAQVTFTKAVDKVNGTSVSSQPSAVSTGDVLRWVLTYQYNGTSPAQADIKDLLPASLQFNHGSLVAPPDWTPQWFNGSWVMSETASSSGVGAFLKFPSITP